MSGPRQRGIRQSIHGFFSGDCNDENGTRFLCRDRGELRLRMKTREANLPK